jgi:hypothetical protein
LLVGEKNFEGVPRFTYLWALINNWNDLGQSMRERIQAGNRACCANPHLFKNQLISPSTNFKTYRTLLHPVVICGADTRSLTVAVGMSLDPWKKNTRKLFGPVWNRGEWRLGYNAELNELIKGHDIVSFVKAERMRWLRNVERISEERMLKWMLKGRLFCRRRNGRPRTRWLDSVVMGVRGWRGGAEDRVGWRRVVKEAKAHQEL